MSNSNCCFLRWSGIPISQNFPQFIVIHTVKDFGIDNKAEIGVFLELSCFSEDYRDEEIRNGVGLGRQEVASLNSVCREDCSEQKTFANRLEGNKRVTHISIWGKWPRQRKWRDAEGERVLLESKEARTA